MKVKVIRSSGHPIDTADIEAYKQDWKELFDKVQDKCKVGIDGTGSASVDMFRMQKLLARTEQILMKRYNRVAEWDFISTPEQAKQVMEQYGNIMLTKRADSGDLLYVILDEDFVQGR